MELYVFDINFNRLGIIDVFNEVVFDLKEHDHSTMSLIVDASPSNIDLLVFEDDLRIITKSTDITRGYLIETGIYDEEEGMTIDITGKSLSSILSWRIVEGQQAYSGKIISVIESFIKWNCIEGFAKTNRIIPNLKISNSSTMTETTEESYGYKPLDDVVWEICKKFKITFEILMNHDDKTYNVKFTKGVDRTDSQSSVPRIIFTKKLDNVLIQSYINDSSGFRNTAYITGGDGKDDVLPTTVVVEDSNIGYRRREIALEANDIKKEYKDDQGEDKVFSQAEFESILNERGKNRLSEFPQLRTFNTEINPNSQYTFGVDYFIGDTVTTMNETIGLYSNVVITGAVETYSRDGYSVVTTFGPGVLSLTDKIKRKVK